MLSQKETILWDCLCLATILNFDRLKKLPIHLNLIRVGGLAGMIPEHNCLVYLYSRGQCIGIGPVSPAPTLSQGIGYQTKGLM